MSRPSPLSRAPEALPSPPTCRPEPCPSSTSFRPSSLPPAPATRFAPEDERLAEFRPEVRSLPSFFVWTLGCQMNRSDSEEMAGRLLAAGCPEAPSMDAADLVVINTCAIREAAEAKVIGRQGHLARLKAARPGMRVVLTGCSVRESNRAGLARRYPAVDLFLRPDEEPELVDRLGLASAQAPVGALAMTAATTLVKGAPVSDASHLVRARADAVAGGAVSRGSAISAWLPIIYGCDKTCTYCIVPFSRGPERSRPFDEIVDEARALAAAGYREVTLLGQNVNSYGHDLAAEARFAHVVTERSVGRRQDREARPDLAELIRAVDGLRAADGDARPAIPRLRFVTSHPWDLSDRLIEAMRDCPSVCESLHLPVQSGSDSMLRRMGRQYTIDHYRERLDRHPRGRARHRAVHGRHRGLLRRDRGRVRGHAPPPRDRPLRPGLRGRLQRAAGDAGHAPGRRRAGGREAAPPGRPAGDPGGDRAGAEPGLARPHRGGPRGHDRAATDPRPRRRGARRHGRVPGRLRPPARGRGAPARALAGEQARPRGRAAGPARVRGARGDRPRRTVRAPGDPRLAHARAPLVVIGGPTATGKTGLAIALAERLIAHGIPAEVVSADSRQVYRGLDIGTAKATPEERARVVHHGIDLVEPDQAYSVAEFRTLALEALASLGQRGGIGILAGGTGFWLRSVFLGIDTDALPSDAGIRAGLEAELTRDGVAALAERLVALAPTLAGRTDLRNPRRVVRALEIATLQGDAPLPEPVGYPAPRPRAAARRRTAEHVRRMAARARAQFDAGLVEEARALRERFDPSLPAFSAIGYRETWAFLDGEITLEQAIELDARRNVAFAKRQRTWFRSEPTLAILDATGDALPVATERLNAFLDSARP